MSFLNASGRKLTPKSSWFRSFGRLTEFTVLTLFPKGQSPTHSSSLMLLPPAWLIMFGHRRVWRRWKIGRSTRTMCILTIRARWWIRFSGSRAACRGTGWRLDRLTGRTKSLEFALLLGEGLPGEDLRWIFGRPRHLTNGRPTKSLVANLILDRMTRMLSMSDICFAEISSNIAQSELLSTWPKPSVIFFQSRWFIGIVVMNNSNEKSIAIDFLSIGRRSDVTQGTGLKNQRLSETK
jgi:hypothetical protein